MTNSCHIITTSHLTNKLSFRRWLGPHGRLMGTFRSFAGRWRIWLLHQKITMNHRWRDYLWFFFVGCLESDWHTELVLLTDPAVYQKCCFKKCFFDWEPRAVPDIPLPASCWNRVDHSKHLRWYSLVTCTYIEILSFCLHIANHFNSLSSNKTCKICFDLRLRTCYELIPMKSSFCSWNFQLERVALPLLEELSKGSVG